MLHSEHTTHTIPHTKINPINANILSPFFISNQEQVDAHTPTHTNSPIIANITIIFYHQNILSNIINTYI